MSHRADDLIDEVSAVAGPAGSAAGGAITCGNGQT